MRPYNLCIIKPNKSSFSETFIQEHIDRLAGNKKVIYGGAFPIYDNQGNYLIKSKWGLLSYLLQKKILKRKDILVRNNALVNYLKKEKIDVVLAEYGMVGAMVTSACKIANIPLVVHFHGADAHQRQTIREYSEYYKKTFDYASSIIAVSNDMKIILTALGAQKNKIFWNPCGVDTEKFSRVNVNSSKPYFLSVGRFVAKKSPQSVIKAFEIVCKQVPDSHLWMVGDGPLLSETKQLVKQLSLDDKITFTGVLSSPQIIELFKQMRCFVQHSVTAPDGDMEGTPVTILEAGASGLPIVSTLHAGIKEAVVDEVTGYLVNEYDIETMAQKMIIIADDVNLAAELGAKSAEHIRRNYDIRDKINNLDKILQKSIS